MINGNACFAYFNKNWGIPKDDCERQFRQTHWYARRAFVIAIATGIVAILSLLIAVVSLLTMLSFVED